MSKYTSYRDILKKNYELRKNKNPSYSLVAFSRDAGFKSYHMSDVLSGRYPLSVKRAHDVAKKLKFNDILTEEFVSLVIIEHSKNKQSVDQASVKLQQQDAQQVHLVNDEDFSPICEWYYLAILEIYRNEQNSLLSAKDISERLNIDSTLAQEAISKLVQHNFLKQNPETSELQTQKEYIAVRTNRPTSQPIRNFHRQVLSKALTSIESLDTDKRHIHSFVMTLDEKDYSLLNKEVANFIKNKINELQETKAQGKVHILSFQTFPVEK